MCKQYDVMKIEQFPKFDSFNILNTESMQYNWKTMWNIGITKLMDSEKNFSESYHKY